MKNYWISPDGKKFKCDNHGCEADRIQEEHTGGGVREEELCRSSNRK